uniref:Uncharacterized protein n=1 Tax=Amphimedon queenslandica TaxID=400682 RepID=A0A1X7SX09_AMPQE
MYMQVTSLPRTYEQLKKQALNRNRSRVLTQTA